MRNMSMYCIPPYIPLAPAHLGPKEIDGLLVSSGKASTLLTGYLINRSSLSLPKKSGSCQTSHIYKLYWFSWVGIFEALVGCHDILILGKSSTKWRQRHDDMTVAVDWDVKHQFKQTNLYPTFI